MIASSKRIALLAVLISRSSAFSTISALRFQRSIRLFSSSQNLEEMRAGEIKKELESYGIPTKTFLEKMELVEALRKARAEGMTPKASTTTTSSEDNSRSTTPSPSTSNSSSKLRDERLAEEMEVCKAMKASDLKKELEGMGILTKTLFEKSEFVKALAVARVDGVTKKNSVDNSRSTAGEEGYAEYANVEVLTDDSAGPRKKQTAQPEKKQQSPFGGENPFGGGGMPGMGGIADMLKNMGGLGGGASPFGGMGGNPFGGGGDMMGKAQEMLKNPKVREIMAKS